VNEADRPVVVCCLLTLGVLLAVWAVDPLYRRWLRRRHGGRALVDEAEQLVRDDHDRITWQSLATRLEEPPR
jgi:hypothetical protein